MTAELVAVDNGWIWVCRHCERSSDESWLDSRDAHDDATNHDVTRHEPYDHDWADELKWAREERIT